MTKNGQNCPKSYSSIQYSVLISVLFNCQYSINRLISDFDFWHLDSHTFESNKAYEHVF